MRFLRYILLLSALLLQWPVDSVLAQRVRADLSDLFHDAPAPLLAAAPLPARAAYIGLNQAAFDRVSPRSIVDATIDRFPLGADRRVRLNLRRIDLMAPHGVAVIGTTSGDRPFTLEKHLIFTGSVDGVAGSSVYLAVFERYSVGYVEITGPGNQQERYMIAPEAFSGDAPSRMIVYDTRELPVAERPHNECGAENLPGYQERVDEVMRRIAEHNDFLADKKERKIAAATTVAAQVALECDLRYFRAHGSSIAQSANYALIVLGASSAIYQRDANVALQIPYLRIWTSTGPYTGPNINDLLGQLRNHWVGNMGTVGRSTTLMLSHNIGGGLAWVGTLCGDYGFSVAGLGNDVNYPATGYLWDVDVASHELGHNFGSAHTHNCAWAPPIDSCVAPEGNCTRETNPRPGSIMSYCHLNVGTNLYLHPRVASLIRKNLEQTACVGPVGGALPNDVAIVQIVAPALGGKITRGATFTPSAIVRNIGTSAQADLSVTFTISSSTTGAPLYATTKVINSIAPGASATVTFDPVALDQVDIYDAKATVLLAGDGGTINNTMLRPFEVVNAASQAAITLNAPNGGEVLAAGSTVPITWSATGTNAVTVEFSADDGQSWSVIRYNQQAAQGTLSWSVPPVPTTRGRIRVSDLHDASAFDISDAPFTVTVEKDIEALDFIAPVPAASTPTPLAPKVEIRNNGRQAARDVMVRLRMMWRGDGSEVYNERVTVGEIAPGATHTVEFPSTPLLPDGTHVMIARATLAGDEQPSNDSIGRSCDLVGLAPPLGVKAYPMSRAVLLTWQPSPSEKVTAYQIYRGRSRDSMSLVATLRPTVRAYGDEPLEDGAEYHYGIAAVSGAKRSIHSRIVAATPMTYPAGFKLGAPQFHLPGGNATRVPVPSRLLWESVAGAEIYQVQIAANSAMTDVIMNQLTTEPHLEVMTAFSSTYYWRVRAFNYSSVGDWSTLYRFTTGDSCGVSALAFDGAAAKMTSRIFTWRDTAVTIEFWNYVRAADVKNSSAFSVGTEVNNVRFQAHAPWSDKTLYWDYGDIGATGRIATNYADYLDKWTHVALVSDGKTFKGIYLDGVLVASGTEASFPPERTNLVVGCFLNDSYHKGLIDELRIWNRVRSQEEIERDMRRTLTSPQPGLVGYWRFDETNGLVVPDVSGGGAHGAITSDTLWRASTAPLNCDNPAPMTAPVLSAPANGAEFTLHFAPTLEWERPQGARAHRLQLATKPDFTSVERDLRNVVASSSTAHGLRPATRYYWRVRGEDNIGAGPWSAISSFTTAPLCETSALRFNGTNTTLRADSFAFAGRAITVEFWNYVDTNEVRSSSAFSIGAGDNTENRLQSHAPWSDKTLYWDYGNIGALGRLTANYAPHLGSWTHVALVSNGIDFKAIYFNGEPAATSTTASMARDLTTLTIGGVPGSWYHRGMIDEFRIWNTARTPEAIRRDMYRKLASPQSGMLGYWSLDEGGGAVAHDSSGFDHDASLVNDPLWQRSPMPIVPYIEPISGPYLSRPRSAGNIYSVSFDAAKRYTWNVTGGEITSGAGSASITVTWGNVIDGIVTLTTEHEDGCRDSVAMAVLLYEGAGVEGDDVAGAFSFTSAPDPFSASTTISYHLSSREHVSLAIYSLDGALVARLVDGVQEAGEYAVPFKSDGLASGIYICRIDIGERYGAARVLHVVK